MAKSETVVWCDENRCINYFNINTCPFGGRIPKKDLPCKHSDIVKRVAEDVRSMAGITRMKGDVLEV